MGRSKIVGRLRRHPLYRALRADKLALAVLEKTLESHRSERATEEVPVLRMLALSKSQVEERTKAFLESYQTRPRLSGLKLEILDGESAIGGGAGPNTHPATSLIAISHAEHSADEIGAALRLSNPPIISRIADGKVLIDFRTVEPQEEFEILEALFNLLTTAER